ncbi:MAG: acetyltransferase [Euryarchaeota archaeon]|nr:acetyltransferase [Euryarchaeota archaeon]
MKEILLIGSGGHCLSCIDVIELEKKFKIIGLVDNLNLKSKFGYKIYPERDLKKLSKKIKYAFITVGQINNFKIREKLFKKIEMYGFKTPSIFSPLSYVSKRAKVEKGSIIMHGSIINAGAIIGKNCIINNKALIEHDVIVRDNCHISTNSTLNGEVVVGNNSFIGSSSVVKQKIKIGKNCFINANIFIDKNLKDNSKIYE